MHGGTHAEQRHRGDDNSGGVTGTFTVTPANGSRAAEALGLLAPVSGNVISGEDRSMVAVESLFTHLKALERALLRLLVD